MNILQAPVLLSAALVPMLASLGFPIVGRRAGPKVMGSLSFLSLLYPLVLSVLLAFTPGLGGGLVDPVFFQHPFVGSFTMLLDPLSLPVVFSIALVTSLVALYSMPYMRHRFEEMGHEGVQAPSWATYFMLYTMFSGAMIGTVLSTNLIEFYIFLELTLMPSFLLIAFYGYGDRMRIAIMYLLWTHVGAGLFLVGVMALGILTGSFDIVNMESLGFNAGLGQRLPGALIAPIALLITLGLFVKMAVFGVHIWLPYAHAEAPTPVSALLSPNLIGIGGYALVRVTYTLFPVVFREWSTYMIGLALVTMVYGGLMALAQDDFKRLLAYSSISQMGYVLLGIAALNGYGITGAILHYVAHAVGKAILFMTAGTLIVQLHGLRSISRMGGLAVKMPLTATLALLGFMNITGVPPSVGLWSEILIVIGAAQAATGAGSTAFLLLAAGLVVAIGLSTAYAFVTMKRIFFGETPESLKTHARDGSQGLIGSILATAIAGILIFLYPAVFMDPLLKMF